MNSILPPHQVRAPALTAVLMAGIGLWGALVAVLAQQGLLLRLVGPQYAMGVVAAIALPTLLYFAVPAIARVVQGWGLRPLSLMHIWRAPAALLFFWFGLQGQLPPLFWIVAGTGDLLVALYAMRLIGRPGDRAFYRRLHVAGFADFALAVSLGLYHTLIGDPRMQTLAMLPMALIPLFGVGLSGASHLIAFDLLRRAR